MTCGRAGWGCCRVTDVRVGRLGLEPRTHGLKVRCSTIELTPRGTSALTGSFLPTCHRRCLSLPVLPQEPPDDQELHRFDHVFAARSTGFRVLVRYETPDCPEERAYP